MTEEEKKELQEIKEEIRELNKTIKEATNMLLKQIQQNQAINMLWK